MTNTIKPWLDVCGKYTVEHVPCPHFSQPVDLDAPRTGVIHTTEGDSIDGALSVFKQHFAPQFLVGPGRILQLVQVGTIGAALVTHNDHAIVQIEVVGFSKQTPWIFDDATLDALASLLATCKVEYGIELCHPWPDGDYGLYGDNPHRHAGKWGAVSGWFGHGDVPSPDEHWDPGALEWSKLFAAAAAKTDILGAPAWAPPAEPPRPCACHPQLSVPTPAVPAAPAPVVAPAATAEPATAIPSWAPASNPVWVRVAQMINAVRAKGAENPLVIATVVNAYHESAVTPKIVGDEGTAFGPWQHHFNPRGARILAGCGVDVRSETSIAKLVDALWWELENVFGASLAKMKAAATGAEATGIFETDIEGAGAAGALSRRVADAGPLEVWISQNESFIAANPAA